jgi:hypothetical protein
MMDSLDKDIEFFTKIRDGLETGKWVLIQNQKLIGTFDTFEVAAEEAVKLFNNGPYLIRQVGAPPIIMPASVVFRVQ